MLKPCPYRKFNQGQLECKITKIPERKYTSSTSVDACCKCQIPEIIQKVNCKNFIPQKLHLFHTTTTFDALPQEIIIGNYWEASCQVIHFANKNDYESKCSNNCPNFQAIHLDLTNEEVILIPGFDSATATDSVLRQAILLVLYKYYSKHPERYNCFDITPEFIAKSLKITMKDVTRILLPMEEEKEVLLEKYLGEECFRYVTITSKGIKMIDEKPLFNNLNTAEFRRILQIENSFNFIEKGDIMSDSYKITNNPGGISQNVSGGNVYGGMQAAQGENNQQSMETDVVASGEKQLTQEDVIRILAQLEQLVGTNPELPEAAKEKSLKYLGAAKEEAQTPEPDKQLAAGNLKRMAETLKTTSETVASTKNLWENAKPFLQELPGWLGVAKSFFGF